jgi:uncharacterized protein (TIGR02001 family)
MTGAHYIIPIAALLALANTPAHAEDKAGEEAPSFDLSLTLGGVSDYRFRGVSLSGRDPALQGSVDVSHDSGVYAGVWASSIAKYAGTRAEVDAYLGWKGDVGPVAFDLAATGYVYPGGRNANYGEINGGISKGFGPAEVRVGVGYAPAQRNIGSDDNLYLSTDAKLAVSKRLTLTGQVGRERGSLAGPTGRKWDWGAGAEWDQGLFQLSVGYVDTNMRRALDTDGNGKAGVVFNLTTGF